jgi:hypothetical protein
MEGRSFGGTVFVIALTVLFSRFLLPMWGFAALVVTYLHYSRGKDSL